MANTNLATALVAAQRSAQAVSKSSTNSFHRYKYASAEAMIEEAREALTGADLALITMKWTVVGAPAEGALGRVVVAYRLFHASGETLDFEAETSVIPEKGRPQDKAEATALTYNLGYFLRGLLLLPREDESLAVDARDDRERGARPSLAKAGAPSSPASTPALPSSAALEAAQLLNRIKVAASLPELIAVGQGIAKSGLPAPDVDVLRAHYAAKKEALGTAPGKPEAA